MKTLSATPRPNNHWKAESLSFLNVLLVWGVLLTSLLIKMRQSWGCVLLVLIFAIIRIPWWRGIPAPMVSTRAQVNQSMSLLGLLCFTSFCLAILNPKDQVLGNECNNNPSSRPRFVALIDPYPSCDGDTLRPVAPAHCWLATHRSV